MSKKLTPEQLETLAPMERYFKQAVEASWCSYPGQENIKTMLRTWEDLTGTQYPYKPGCSHCLMNLVRDMGTLYFAAKAELISKLREKNKDAEFKEIQIGDYSPAKASSEAVEGPRAEPAVNTTTEKKKAKKAAKK